jgi:phosphatidylglycerophosphate synthase
MSYTMKDILASLTPEKKKSDGTMTACVYRPLSFPVSWFFLKLGFSPNAVTGISALFCLAAFVLALIPVTACHWIAIAFFFAFAVLDCTDGNMARTIGKKTVYGGWVDAAGGYLAYTTELFAIGLSCFFAGDGSLLGYVLPWGKATWILIAAIAISANLLMRLFHQALKNAEIAAGLTVAPGKEKRFSEEIGITGYLPVLYAAGFATGTLPFVLAAYTAIYAGGFAVTSLKQIMKVAKAA